MRYKNQERVKREWSSNFAYAIGLIASDGNIRKDKSYVKFASKDLDLINHFQKGLSVKNKITKRQLSDRFWYTVEVGDKIFCEFLNSIGLHPCKSKTIQFVTVPDEYFADFVRGVFDGDGTFYSSWDTRWPNSFVFQISFASASYDFIHWFQSKLTKLYDVKGFIRQGDGVFNLRYVKGDSRRLFDVMYYRNDILFLNRKYKKIKDAFEIDTNLKLMRIHNKSNAGLAHR